MGGTLPALVLCWVLPGGIARIPGVWTLWVPGWGARAELQHPACRASERNQSSSVAVETGGETQFLAASTSLPGILRTLASGGVKRSPPPPFPTAAGPGTGGSHRCPLRGSPRGAASHRAGAAVVGTGTICSALFWGGGGPCCTPALLCPLPGEDVNVFSMYMCNIGLMSPPESGLEGLATSTQLGWLRMFWGAGGGKGRLIKTPPALTSSFQNLPPEILKTGHVGSHR